MLLNILTKVYHERTTVKTPKITLVPMVKYTKMEAANNEAKTSVIGKEWIEGSPEIELNQMCFVRALKDTSQIKILGPELEKEVYLPHLNELTAGEYDRSTIHWAINHKVGNHLYGSWFNSRVVVLAPTEGLVERNGLPESLNAVDTFWSKGMFLPQGSKILLIGESVKLDSQNLNDIQIIKSKVTDDELQRLKDLEKASVDDYTNFSKNTEYQSFGKKIDKTVTEEVNKLIGEMGYTVLDGDHSTYMSNENLDSAISYLAAKEGIKQSGIHAYTLFGEMEDYLGDKGLLDTISTYSFEKKSPSEKKTDFSILIKDLTVVFNRYPIESKGKEDFVLRFSAEFYSALIKYPKIVDEFYNCTAVMDLFDFQPAILKNISEWANNDKENGQIVLERIEKLKRFRNK